MISNAKGVHVSELDISSLSFEQLSEIFKPNILKNQEPERDYLISSGAFSSINYRSTKQRAIARAEALSHDFEDVQVWRLEGNLRVPIWPIGPGSCEPVRQYQIQAIDHLRGKACRRTRIATKSKMIKLAQELFPKLTDVAVFLKKGNFLVQVWPEK